MNQKKTYKKLSDTERKYIWQHRYELSPAQLSVIIGAKDATVRSYMRSKRIASKREAGKRGVSGNN